MKWCRTTASAEDRSSHLCQWQHLFCKFFRIHVIGRLSVFQFRKTGIWLYYKRNAADTEHSLHDLMHFIRAGRTVQSHSINAHGFHYDNRRLRIRTKQCTHIILECQCYKDWNRISTSFFDRKNCSTAFLQAHHRLYGKQIHAGIDQRIYLFFVHVDQFFQRKCSHRIQLFSGHRHITGDVNLTRRATLFHCLPAECNQLLRHLMKFVFQSIFGKFDPVTGKCRRIKHIASCQNILFLQFHKYIRVVQNPKFRTFSCLHSMFL